MLKNVLIIEDDKEIAENLRALLLQRDIKAYSVLHGQEIKRLLQLQKFDLVILDLMLPHKNGLQLTQEIKAIKNIPIIIISALKDSHAKVNALELGADDFLDKPVDIDEIIMRANSIINRKLFTATQHKCSNSDVYDFNGWSLDINMMKIISPEGVSVALSKQLYNILVLFMQHPNKILTRDFIAESIYGQDYDHYDRGIDVAISKLRKRLQDKNTQQSIIKTYHGKGYCLNADIGQQKEDS